MCDKNAWFYNLFTKINLVSSWAEVICPHLYKGIQRVLAQPKSVQFTNCLLTPYHYICRFAGASLRMKLQLPHFTRDFAGVIMRTKFSPLHLYKSSFQRQVTTLTQKNLLLAYIKATIKAFWWGATQNLPHLIATRMAFWLGAFSKIKSMFTNSLSSNSLEKKQNLRLQRKYPHLLP